MCNGNSGGLRPKHHHDHHHHQLPHGSGTITEYAPGSAFIVKESAGPVTYRYGENVTYVTRSGAPLTEEQVRTHVKVGAPVRVQYSSEGENRILNRVEIDDIEIDDD